MHKLLHQLFKKYQSAATKIQGQGLVEYALILGLAAIAVFAIVQLMRPAIEETFLNIAGNAPLAPPSLANYTPPPTSTAIPDPNASDTPTPTPTNTPTETPISTDTPIPTETPTSTATPDCSGFGPYDMPGQVQAENFACGGPNNAFVDNVNDGGPGSGDYRADVTSEGPDLSSGGSGYYVGWIELGEWISYDIEVSGSQTFDFSFRVASDNGNGRFHIEYIKDGNTLYTSSTILVPNTGGGTAFTDVSLPAVPMVGGTGRIKIVIETGGFNLDYFEVFGSALPTATNSPTPTDIPTETPTPTNTPIPTETPTPTATPISACQIYDSADVPKNINDASWGNPGRTYSIIYIPDTGTVTDVNVLNLIGSHTDVHDLEFYLTNPRGVEVKLIGQDCRNRDDFDLNLDDEAASGTPPCPPTDGGTYQPSSYLGDFDSEDVQNTWTLRIDDLAWRDTGVLESWSLEICTQ